VRLLVYDEYSEKATSKWLLVSKIQVVRGEYMGDFLLGFFITHLEDLEDFSIILSLSL
jgi:hypothetical protein